MGSRKEKFDNNVNKNKNRYDEDEDIPTIDTRKAKTVGPSTKGRQYAKDVNISGLEYVHFGNTFVSYGVINVEGGEPPDRRPHKPDNLMDYLKLEDNLAYGNINRPPRRGNVNFNNTTRTPITITRRPINMRVNPKKLDLHDVKKEKMKMYLLMGVYAVLALLIVALLCVVYFKIGQKQESTPYIPKPGDDGEGEPYKPLPRNYGIGNKDCSKYYKPYVKKTRLRLVITKSLLYYCSNDADEMKCYNEFSDEYYLHKKNNFKDIYFNYIINSKGNIFSGRSPVDCPFEEDFFIDANNTNTHEDVITVGIGYCFNDESAGKFRKSDKESEAIKKLIYFLQNSTPGRGIGRLLEKDITLELLDECKESSLFYEVNSIAKVTFLKPDDATPAPLKEIIYTGGIPQKKYYPDLLLKQQYRVVFSELDTAYLRQQSVCESYFSESYGTSMDYIVLLNGVHCQRKNIDNDWSFTVKLVAYDGSNEKGEVQNMALIRNNFEWQRQELFLKTILKLSTDITTQYGNNRITSICNGNPDSKFKMLLPIIALTFNGEIGDQETPGRDCPNSNRHNIFRMYPSYDMFGNDFRHRGR